MLRGLPPGGLILMARDTGCAADVMCGRARLRDRGRNLSDGFVPVERKDGCRETNARRNHAAEDHAAPAPPTSVRRSCAPSKVSLIRHVRLVECDGRRECTAPLHICDGRTA